MDWLDLLAVQETLKSLLQHHSSKASILWHSAVFIVQLSHPYMTTGKTIAVTIAQREWTYGNRPSLFSQEVETAPVTASHHMLIILSKLNTTDHTEPWQG